MPAVPQLVEGLQSQFLANVSANLASCAFLTEDARAHVGSLLRASAPVGVVADALFAGFAEDWANRRAALARDLPEHLRPVPPSWHGAERLFVPLKDAFVMPRQTEPKPQGEFLSALGAADPSAGRVLEFDYPVSVTDQINPVAEDQLDGIHTHWSSSGVGVYTCDDDGRLTVRIPSLTALELGLLVFSPNRSAGYCITPALVSPDDLNELHRLGYHPIALPMKAIAVHREEEEHPLEAALHDAMHTYLWPVAWLRQSMVLFYDSLRTLGPQVRPDMTDQELMVLDLAYRSAEEIVGGVERVVLSLDPSSGAAFVRDYVRRLEAFPFDRANQGIRVLKRNLHRLLGEMLRGVPL
jgi:hypothetical protein